MNETISQLIYILVLYLTYMSSVQLIGVFFDITGAFYLSRAFMVKKPADIKNETYGSANQRTHTSFGMSGNLFFSFYTQGVEAKIGFILLLTGFLLQAVGILWPLIKIPLYLSLILWLLGSTLSEMVRSFLTAFERVKSIHDRDERQYDKRLQK